MMTLRDITKATGLQYWQVQYRLRKLNIKPKKIHQKLFLWPESAVQRILDFEDGRSKKNKDAK